jgi:hypothetical protein
VEIAKTVEVLKAMEVIVKAAETVAAVDPLE